MYAEIRYKQLWALNERPKTENRNVELLQFVSFPNFLSVEVLEPVPQSNFVLSQPFVDSSFLKYFGATCKCKVFGSYSRSCPVNNN